MKMNNTKKFLFITAGVFFAILLIINAVMFYFINPGFILIPVFMVSLITVLIFSFVISGHFSGLNRVKSDGSKKSGYFLKKMWVVIVLMFFFSFGLSFAGGLILNGIFGGMRLRIENPFLSGAIVKIPLFILYNIIIYRMIVKQGFLDSQKKSFNLHLKILAFILVLILIMPSVFMDSMYDTVNPDSMMLNFHTMLSPNIDLFAHNDLGDVVNELNPDFNMALVIITILISFAAELFIAAFAYLRGKKIFIAQHLRKTENYETDEIC